MAQAFRKPTVFHYPNGMWIRVGPGHLWLGDQYDTWEDALFDRNKVRERNVK